MGKGTEIWNLKIFEEYLISLKEKKQALSETLMQVCARFQSLVLIEFTLPYKSQL